MGRQVVVMDFTWFDSSCCIFLIPWCCSFLLFVDMQFELIPFCLNWETLLRIMIFLFKPSGHSFSATHNFHKSSWFECVYSAVQCYIYGAHFPHRSSKSHPVALFIKGWNVEGIKHIFPYMVKITYPLPHYYWHLPLASAAGGWI